MKKFDWIDFGYSWEEEWESKPVSREFHASTVSLIAEKLRGRPFAFRKIFLCMRSRVDSLISQTRDVLHLESSFPFQRYIDLPDERRLDLFARWAMQNITTNASSLLKGAQEGSKILDEIRAELYTYVRRDRVKRRDVGKEVCIATFNHSPYKVDARLVCTKSGIEFEFPPNTFRRDELDYAKSISGCWVERERLFVETYKGVFDVAFTRSTASRE